MQLQLDVKETISGHRLPTTTKLQELIQSYKMQTEPPKAKKENAREGNVCSYAALPKVVCIHNTQVVCAHYLFKFL